MVDQSLALQRERGLLSTLAIPIHDGDEFGTGMRSRDPHVIRAELSRTNYSNPNSIRQKTWPFGFI